jgi:cytochrome c556
MKSVFVLALALSVAVCGLNVRAEDKDEKVPPIKTIMKKVHGKGGLQGQVSAALKEKDFKKAGTAAKEWFELAQALTKNTPKKGEAEDFKKTAGTYCTTVKTLTEAIEKEEAKSANGAMGKIGSMCKTCHTAHR